MENDQLDHKKEKKEKKREEKKKQEEPGKADERLPTSLKFLFSETRVGRTKLHQSEISQNVFMNSNLSKLDCAVKFDRDPSFLEQIFTSEAVWIEGDALEDASALDAIASMDCAPSVVLLYFRKKAENTSVIARMLSLKGTSSIVQCTAGDSKGSVYNCMLKASQLDLRKGISQLLRLREDGIEVTLYGVDICFTP
jgi:hypothetical protein